MDVNLKIVRMHARKRSGLLGSTERVKMTIEELAVQMSLPVEQAIFYENTQDEIDDEIVARWCKVCGFKVKDAERLPDPEMTRGIETGDVYRPLYAELDLLYEYAAHGPALPESLPEIGLTAVQLTQRVRDWQKKPYVLITGRFDSGKTRLANAFLGCDNLPSQYTPTTSIANFVRHISEKPDWQREAVWVLRKGFNPAQWRDENHCRRHLVTSGGFDVLRQFGVKGGAGEKEGATAALVYMDSPVLLACALVDVPGFQDDAGDAQLAVTSASFADVLIYTSPAKGFLDQADFLYLSQLLRSLKPVHANGSPLANFFLLATHADPSISDEELQRILDRGAERLYRQFGETLFAEANLSMSREQVRARIFPFWYESRRRRQRLEAELTALLGLVMPEETRRTVNRQLGDFRQLGSAEVKNHLAGYDRAFNEIETARKNIERLRRHLPEYKSDIARTKAAYKDEILRIKRDTQAFITTEVAPMITPTAIEAFIRKEFDRARDDAKKDALPKLLELAQGKLETFLKKEARTLLPYFEKYMREYELVSEGVGAFSIDGQISIPFNAQGAFAGGLAASGMVGVLAVWSSLVGNLGGYILVAKLASVMTAVGVGVGSGALVTFVAAIGGPVTLTIGLAAALALGIWSLFGDDWQTRLAKKLSKSLEEQDYIKLMRENTAKYWDDALLGFEIGASSVESSFDTYLEKNEQLVRDRESKQRIEQAIVKLEELGDFFDGIPWRESD